MGNSSSFNISLVSFTLLLLALEAATINRIDLELAAGPGYQGSKSTSRHFPGKSGRRVEKIAKKGETVDDVVRKIKWAGRPGLRWQR